MAGRSELFFGWKVVGAVFVLAMFGWGLGFYGPPIYLHAVREVRGWSVSLVSAAVTVHFLIGAAVVTQLPRLHRTYGVARVTKAGSIALAIGVFGWAIAREPWQLFCATLLSGSGWVAMGAAAVNAIISPWFVQDRPKALSQAYNGASIGGVIFSPLWVAAIASLGFGTAALAIGIVMVVMIWLLADNFYGKIPAEMGLIADGRLDDRQTANASPTLAPPLDGAKLWQDWQFITLAAGMALGLFAQIGLLAHLYSLLVPALGLQLAGFATGAATAAAIVGRSAVGWFLPASADRRVIAALSYLVQITGSLMFVAASGSNIPLLIIGVVLFGAGIGNATSLPPLIAQKEFAPKDITRVVPAIVAIGQSAYAFAPAAFGVIRELSPSTTEQTPWLFIAAAIVQCLAIVALMLGRRRS